MRPVSFTAVILFAAISSVLCAPVAIQQRTDGKAAAALASKMYVLSYFALRLHLSLPLNISQTQTPNWTEFAVQWRSKYLSEFRVSPNKGFISLTLWLTMVVQVAVVVEIVEEGSSLKHGQRAAPATCGSERLKRAAGSSVRCSEKGNGLASTHLTYATAIGAMRCLFSLDEITTHW